MRKGWLLVLLAFLTITACGPREAVKKPEVFLTEEQMVDVLSDSYLVEAMLNRRRGAGETSQAYSVPITPRSLSIMASPIRYSNRTSLTILTIWRRWNASWIR